MFDVCTTGDTAHIDMIFKFLLTHASTWVHQHSSLLQWSVPCTNGLVCRWVLRVLCTKCTLRSNHRLIHVIFQHTKDFSPRAAILSLHTLASPSGTNVNYDGKKLTGKTFLSCSFSLYRFRKCVSYGFPIINFVIPEYIMKCPVCIYIHTYIYI
jgi:hypothetical protein